MKYAVELYTNLGEYVKTIDVCRSEDSSTICQQSCQSFVGDKSKVIIREVSDSLTSYYTLTVWKQDGGRSGSQCCSTSEELSDLLENMKLYLIGDDERYVICRHEMGDELYQGGRVVECFVYDNCRHLYGWLNMFRMPNKKDVTELDFAGFMVDVMNCFCKELSEEENGEQVKAIKVEQDRCKTVLYNAISLLIDETFEQYDDSEEWFTMVMNNLDTTKEELEELGIKLTVDGGLSTV